MLGSIGAAATISLAGCGSNTTSTDVFPLEDIGLVERGDNVAAYAEVTNTSK